MSGKSSQQEEIVQMFGKMRMEQQQSAQKLYELEQDLHEHKVVIKVLEGVDKSRRCFRLVGGVLVERTVSDILPDLRHNMKELGDKVEGDRRVLGEKSRELNTYQQKHNIRVQFRGAGDSAAAATSAGAAVTPTSSSSTEAATS